MSDPVVDLKKELLAAADREIVRRYSHRRRVLLTSATVMVAAALVLVVTSPWSKSPTFLDRAQAALAHATVLHAKWEDTTTSTDPSCTVEGAPTEIWIDLTPPYRYRARMHAFPPDPVSAPAPVPVCVSGPPTEIGGTFEPLETFRFEPPNTLRVSPLRFRLPPDPVVEFREALAEGRAHDEGDTELAGRMVRRIRVDPLPCPDASCPREPSFLYVDPETFHPIEIRGPAGADARSPVHIVTRYSNFEYLPRTPATVALADIHAQHPLATVANGWPATPSTS